jgi:hypothetical protein
VEFFLVYVSKVEILVQTIFPIYVQYRLEASVVIHLKQSFAELIQTALTARFGRTPSAAFVANQVNRRLSPEQGISGETARRWLRGLTMPTYIHLRALAAWLEIDFGKILRDSASVEALPPPMQLGNEVAV